MGGGGDRVCIDFVLGSGHDRNNFADKMTFKILGCFQKLIIIQIDNLHLITNS